MEVTLDGLRHWYKRHVQKWGSIAIGLEQQSRTDRTARTERYLESSARLLRAIEEKMGVVESPDTRRDLQLMSLNVKFLVRHVQKALEAATQEADATGAYMGEQKYYEEKRRREEERRRRAALKSK